LEDFGHFRRVWRAWCLSGFWEVEICEAFYDLKPIVLLYYFLLNAEHWFSKLKFLKALIFLEVTEFSYWKFRVTTELPGKNGTRIEQKFHLAHHAIRIFALGTRRIFSFLVWHLFSGYFVCKFLVFFCDEIFWSL
jgi:hypothetical protein